MALGHNQSFILQGEPKFPTQLYNINGRLMRKFTQNLNSGHKLIGGKILTYGLNNGCVNFTSRALFYSGVINVNALLPLTAPVLLSAEIGLRNMAIYSSPYIINY